MRDAQDTARGGVRRAGVLPAPGEACADAARGGPAQHPGGGARGCWEPFLAPPPATADELLGRLFTLSPTRWLRRAPGRETFVWPGRPELVVKRAGPSGAVGPEAGRPAGPADRARAWWRGRRRGAARSSGQREAETLCALAADGFPVPRVLGWVAEPGVPGRGHGPGAGRSAIVMGRVEHDGTLAERLERAPPPERRLLARRLAELVGRFHARGWYHRDLYLHHLLVAGDALVLVDVGRARHRRRPRERWLVKDLAALLATAPPAVPAAERLRFLLRWRAAQPRPPGRSARALARAVERKARRLARHRPRFVEPGGRLDRRGAVEGSVRAGSRHPP